jgi:hypothetical protein
MLVISRSAPPGKGSWPFSVAWPQLLPLGGWGQHPRVAPLPLNLIKEPNVARPELELIGLILGQTLMRQFGYRIGRNALPNLCKHVSRRNRGNPALFPPDARERNNNNRGAAYFRFCHAISMAQVAPTFHPRFGGPVPGPRRRSAQGRPRNHPI